MIIAYKEVMNVALTRTRYDVLDCKKFRQGIICEEKDELAIRQTTIILAMEYPVGITTMIHVRKA